MHLKRLLTCVVAATLMLHQLPKCASGKILSVSVANNASENTTNLVSITLDDGRILSPDVGGLISVSAFHFNITSATSGVSTTLLSPDTTVAQAVRLSLISDIALNTGMLNPGIGSGISPGASPTSVTPGFGVTFDTPVLNGPGEDVVIFDLCSTAAQPGDSFYVTALGNGIGFQAVSLGFAQLGVANTSGAYQVTGSMRSARPFTQPNSVTTLADITNKNVTAGTAFSSPAFRGLAFDLTSLGVSQGGQATGLFVQSINPNLVDPVYIAGIASVPEPSCQMLLGIGGILALLCVAHQCRSVRDSS